MKEIKGASAAAPSGSLYYTRSAFAFMSCSWWKNIVFKTRRGKYGERVLTRYLKHFPVYIFCRLSNESIDEKNKTNRDKDFSLISIVLSTSCPVPLVPYTALLQRDLARGKYRDPNCMMSRPAL